MSAIVDNYYSKLSGRYIGGSPAGGNIPVFPPTEINDIVRWTNTNGSAVDDSKINLDGFEFSKGGTRFLYAFPGTRFTLGDNSLKELDKFNFGAAAAIGHNIAPLATGADSSVMVGNRVASDKTIINGDILIGLEAGNGTGSSRIMIGTYSTGGGASSICLGANIDMGSFADCVVLGEGGAPTANKQFMITSHPDYPRLGVIVFDGTGTPITVTTSVVTASSRILLFPKAVGAGAQGFHYLTGIVPGTSFTAASTSATDTSTVSWLVFDP